jgi:uncharacterized damage-inducible protein DinB
MYIYHANIRCILFLILRQLILWHVIEVYLIFPNCTTQVSNYEKELEEMKHMTRQEYIAYLRRYIHMHICTIKQQVKNYVQIRNGKKKESKSLRKRRSP